MVDSTRNSCNAVKLSRNNLKYFSVILIGVLIAYAVNRIEGAISPLFFAMVLGMIMGNSMSWGESGREASEFAAKKCLRFGVVLLGFQISISKFLEVGPRGFLAVALIVTSVFVLLRYLSRKLGFSDSLATLISGGFAICGATAIAAISSTRKSEERDVSYAVALVTLCGTLSVFAIPAIAALIGLSDATAGAWIGAAVHDVGQVIATATLMGPEALESAVIVKLTRVVLLVPLIFFLARGNSTSNSIRKSIPTFVFAFIGCALLVNVLPLSDSVITLGKESSKIALSIGLFGMGLSVRWSQIRTLGAKPLIFGLAAWVACATFALGVIRAAGL